MSTMNSMIQLSRLRNTFLRNRAEMSRKEYKKQWNVWANLLKKAKKEDFANLDVNPVSDDKKF